MTLQSIAERGVDAGVSQRPPGRITACGRVAGASAENLDDYEARTADGVHEGIVTGLVDRLESKGLVRRTASDEDRRVKVIELTPKGARLRAAFMERMAAPPEGLERLSVREQQTLVRILARLLE